MDATPLLEEGKHSSSFDSSLLLNLYVGHFLARWGARMWEFSVGLYMISIWPDSLLLTALYGIVETASTALFGPCIGHLVDKSSYIQVLRLWLMSQNLSFIVAGGAVIATLIRADYLSANYTTFIALVALINISGSVAVLSTLAGTILIEREWVVVISEGEPPDVLTKMNSVIRRIDLSCKLFAPVVSGFIISFISLTASAVTLVVWNVLSVCIQYWLLMNVYNGIPKLREINRRRESREFAKGTASANPEQENLPITEANESAPIQSSSTWKFSNIPYIAAWRSYIRQDVAVPGLALALLYFTVLSFGTLMTAALKWQGVPAYIIGIARGVGAVVGIAATFLYPVLQLQIATLRTGLWSIWSQWSCLLLCIGSIFVKDKLISAYMLMVGVASSRLGLWMFDLSVIQLMQDHIVESDRCVVGGVQNSLQSFLDLMTYIMGMIISHPQDFWKLTTLSFVLVTLAALMYSTHVYHMRGHLFHFEKILAILRLS